MQLARTRSLVEGGILSAMAIVFALISVYIPVLGMFVNLLWPVPVILLGVRHGFRWSFLCLVVSCTIIAILVHPLQALSVLLGFGLIALTLGYCFRRRFSPFKVMLWGSVASFISKGLIIAAAFAFMGINPISTQLEGMTKGMDMVMELYRGFGLSETDLATLEQTMRTTLDLMKVILPAGFAVASVVDTYINFWIAKAVLKKLGFVTEPFPPLRKWNLPMSFMWLYGASLLLVMLYHEDQSAFLYQAGVNLQVIANVALLIQGIALLAHLSFERNWPKWLRPVAIVLMLTNGIFTQMVVLAGAFDLAIDYRKLRRPNDEEKETR